MSEGKPACMTRYCINHGSVALSDEWCHVRVSGEFVAEHRPADVPDHQYCAFTSAVSLESVSDKRVAGRIEMCDSVAQASPEFFEHRCIGYVRRFTRLSIPRAAGRSSEERGFWVTHLTCWRKPRGTAAWWESESGQKMRMAGAREARAIG